MVATLARSGNNSYSLGNQRSFDAWGLVRLGAQTGDPSGRYCANLGHKQDDESGLVYMRARYYEPTSGRFISQDPSHRGSNWLAYCSADPVNKCDSSGKREEREDAFSNQLYFALLSMFEDYARYLAVVAVIGYIEAIVSFIEGDADAALMAAAIGCGCSLMSVAVYLAAGDAADTVVDVVNDLRQKGGFAPSAGLTLLGQAGIMIAGLGMGLEPDDADAWVWGF
jgi:RHS repeat-associated protein